MKKFKCDKCGTEIDVKEIHFPYDVTDAKSHIKWCLKCMKEDSAPNDNSDQERKT